MAAKDNPYDDAEMDARSTINELVRCLPSEQGEAMYETATMIAHIIRECGTDILTTVEKKRLVELAKLLIRRYSLEYKSLKFNKEMVEQIKDDLEFLYNLVD